MTEYPPTLRMLASILEHVGQFFDDAGLPLSPEQSLLLLRAQDSFHERAATLQAGGF